jgi:hypothetical protein
MPRWRWWIHLLLIAALPLLIGVQGIGGSEIAPALAPKDLLLVCVLLLTSRRFRRGRLASRASWSGLPLAEATGPRFARA